MLATQQAETPANLNNGRAGQHGKERVRRESMKHSDGSSVEEQRKKHRREKNLRNKANRKTKLELERKECDSNVALLIGRCMHLRRS